MTSLYYQDVQFKVTGIGRIGTVIQKARHESFMTVISRDLIGKDRSLG